MVALSSNELATLTWSLALLGAGDLEELLGAVARQASRVVRVAAVCLNDLHL